MLRRFGLCFALSIACTGLPAVAADDLHAEDVGSPHMRAAQQDIDNNKPAEAAGEFLAALQNNPNLAGAEFQLGVLYSDKLHDPIAAIYHMRRFKQLSPNSSHVPEAEAVIEKQSRAFADTLPVGQSEAVLKLQADNALLKRQVDDAAHTISTLQTQLASAGAHPAAAAPTAGQTTAIAAGTAPAPSGPQKALPIDQMNPNVPNPDASTNSAAAAAPLTGSRTYTVKKGDVVWTIAHKMYPGHTKEGVEKIQEANKEVMGKPLKIGQVLAIPD